jgi:hypothetical protein
MKMTYLLRDMLGDTVLLISHNVYLQVASTAKLFATPLHGSPNVFVETSMLQLFDPTQACKVPLVSKPIPVNHKEEVKHRCALNFINIASKITPSVQWIER